MTSNNYKHLSIEERKFIESLLNTSNIMLKTIAQSVGRSSKTIREEIKKHRFIKDRTNKRNKCGRQSNCFITRLCSDCLYGHCASCRIGKCNDICPDFIHEPICSRTSKFPFVCNGCTSISKCKLPKFFYQAEIANSEHQHAVSDWKKGPRLNENELASIIPIIQNGIRNKQSLDVIIHKNNLKLSVSTAYRYIQARYIPGCMNIDLKRKVRYKERITKLPELVKINHDYLNGRSYEDYLERLNSNPNINYWEMDTVMGKKGANEKCVLSLLYRKSNLQLYFLLNECNSREVNKIFDSIKMVLGSELFKETFAVILTDNGREFSEPYLIESDPESGEVLINVYYCHPRHSEEKGKCEKNHEHFREMIPKGISMNSLTKKEINYVSNMVNNYARKMFNYHSPLEVSQLFLNKKVFSLNHLSLIPPNQVKLNTILK